MNATIVLSEEQVNHLKSEMQRYTTVCCSMMHEQVVAVDAATLIPGAERDAVSVTRNEVCDKATRDYMLGCAHTNANDRFARLADTAYNYGLLEMTNKPSAILNLLFVRIYEIDQEKGYAEKDLAIAQARRHTEAAREAKARIKDILQRHAAARAELERLRVQIMASVSKDKQ